MKHARLVGPFIFHVLPTHLETSGRFKRNHSSGRFKRSHSSGRFKRNH